MNYSANRKNLLWLGILTAIGAAGYLVTNVLIFAADYLRHPVFHLLTFLAEIPVSVFLCSPFILLSVYIFCFAGKELNHLLLSASCVLFLIKSAGSLLVVGGAPFVLGYEELLKVIVPLETVEDLIISGNIYAFSDDLRLTLGFYESLISVIFSVIAVISVNKEFKRLRRLKVLAIIIIILNVLTTFNAIPFGIDELSYGNPGYLMNVIFNSVATVSFFLFWIVGIKKTENNPEQTDTKTELKKAKYLLEIGLISQKEFEERQEKILEQN